MGKMNCWEFMSCGRQPGGVNAYQGICPVSTKSRLNGIHGGINGGRACWVVGGTLCKGSVQETFAGKYESCMECDFYKLVKTEESSGFRLSAGLYLMIH